MIVKLDHLPQIGMNMKNIWVATTKLRWVGYPQLLDSPLKFNGWIHPKISHPTEKRDWSITSWWFQPISKILVKLGIFPKKGWKHLFFSVVPISTSWVCSQRGLLPLIKLNKKYLSCHHLEKGLPIKHQKPLLSFGISPSPPGRKQGTPGHREIHGEKLWRWSY